MGNLGLAADGLVEGSNHVEGTSTSQVPESDSTPSLTLGCGTGFQPVDQRQDAGATPPLSSIDGVVTPRDGKGERCWVVMYHYVHDPDSLERLGLPGRRTGVRGLTAQQFRDQLDQLCRVYEPISWPTLYAWTRGRGSLPHRSVLLTFDDGLADHARVVLPILEERGLRGVFFVPGAVLASQRMLPAHAIHLLLSLLDEETLERELVGILREHGFNDEYGVGSREAEAGAAKYAYESPRRARLKHWLTFVLPRDLRCAAIDALFKRHIGSTARWARRWYLDWDDLVAMQAHGHTIGGHGFSHEPYLRLTPGEYRRDLCEIGAVLRNGLGPDIRPFSFPYGSFDDDVWAAARDAGFAHGFTTEHNPVQPGSDIGCLPRVDAKDVGAVVAEEFGCLRD